MHAKKRAFSLAEIIVSMGLIVTVSAVGFLACTVSMRIGLGGGYEMQGYADAEMICLSLDAAYRSVGGDKERKADFMKALTDELGWYFGADELTATVQGKDLRGEPWTVEIEAEDTDMGRGISVYYYGVQNGYESYAYEIEVDGVTHHTVLNLNIRTAIFYTTVAAYKSGDRLAFYEREYRYE